MTPPSPIERFLEELVAELPRGRGRDDLLDEARDHLEEAADALERAGETALAAQQRAVGEFGAVTALGPDLAAALVVRGARRQAVRQLAVVALLSVPGLLALRLAPLLRGDASVLQAGPPFVARLVAVGILAPSIALWLVCRSRRVWNDAHAGPWLQRAGSLTQTMVVLVVPLAAAIVGKSVAYELPGAPPVWACMAIAAIAGHAVTHWAFETNGRRLLFP